MSTAIAGGFGLVSTEVISVVSTWVISQRFTEIVTAYQLGVHRGNQPEVHWDCWGYQKNVIPRVQALWALLSETYNNSSLSIWLRGRMSTKWTNTLQLENKVLFIFFKNMKIYLYQRFSLGTGNTAVNRLIIFLQTIPYRLWSCKITVFLHLITCFLLEIYLQLLLLCNDYEI